MHQTRDYVHGSATHHPADDATATDVIMAEYYADQITSPGRATTIAILVVVEQSVR